ncbi:MAG: ATP-binding protein [Syntrophorhabdales bacterium]
MIQGWRSLFVPRGPGLIVSFAILITFAISFLALVGWGFSVVLLTNIKSQWITIRVVTAICLALSALELAFLQWHSFSVRRSIVLQAPGVLVGLVGLLTIVAYAIKMITGQEPSLGDAPFLNLLLTPPARMALLTAIVFLIIGCALVLLATGGRRAAHIAHAVMVPAAMVSYLVPVTYVLGIQGLHGWYDVPVALHTGIAFCTISIAIFCIRPDTWLMRVFTGGHTGSVMARRLLPAFLMIPLLIGWLRLYGERAGAFESEVGVALVALTYTFCLFWIMWMTARSVNKVDDRRRQTDEALRESEERYRNLFNTMDEGFSVIEMIFDAENRPADYRFLEVNAAFERQTGLHDAEGKLMRDLAPDHEAHWFETYGKIALTGEPLHFGNEARALNRWYDVYAYRVGKPEDRQVAIIFNDITEVKRAEKVLQKAHDELEQRVRERTESLRRQAELIELSHEAIFVRDLDSRIVFWNSGAEETYGWTKAEAVGNITHAFLKTQFPVPFDEHMAALVAEDRWEGELVHTRKDGARITVLSRQALQRDEAGKPTAILEINIDITERKRADDEIKRHAAKLEVSNRELQDFAFVASHDLQEPLRKIQAFGDQLKSGHTGSLDAEGLDYLDRMQSAAVRMQALIQSLLNYSRVTSKAQPFSQIDLAAVAREAVGDLEASIKETDGRVEIGDLANIDADSTQMRQLFQNLIGNALKFHGDEKPVIRVYGETVENPGPKKSASRDGGYRIFVEDNGIGFDEKYLDRIFTPFQRLHGRGTYEGTGIGLAICRKIVERHGGTITAKSTAGKGSTFIVTLPANQPKGGTG